MAGLAAAMVTAWPAPGSARPPPATGGPPADDVTMEVVSRSSQAAAERMLVRFVRAGSPRSTRRVEVSESHRCTVVPVTSDASYSARYRLKAPADAPEVAICECADGPGEVHLAPSSAKRGVLVRARFVFEGAGLFVAQWPVLQKNALDACDAGIDGKDAPEDPRESTSND